MTTTMMIINIAQLATDLGFFDFFLTTRSYVTGDTPTSDDAAAFAIVGPDQDQFLHVARWYKIIASFVESERDAWPPGQGSVTFPPGTTTLGDLADEWYKAHLWLRTKTPWKPQTVLVTLCEKKRLFDTQPKCGFSDNSCGFVVSRDDMVKEIAKSLGKKKYGLAMVNFSLKKELTVPCHCLRVPTSMGELPHSVKAQKFDLNVTKFVPFEEGSSITLSAIYGAAVVFVTRNREVLAMKDICSDAWLKLKWATPERMEDELGQRGEDILGKISYRELCILAEGSLKDEDFKHLWGSTPITEANRNILQIVQDGAKKRLEALECLKETSGFPREFINARWGTVKGSVDFALEGVSKWKSDKKLLVRSWTTVVDESCRKLPVFFPKPPSESIFDKLLKNSVQHKVLEWKEEGVTFNRMVFFVPLDTEHESKVMKDMKFHAKGVKTTHTGVNRGEGVKMTHTGVGGVFDAIKFVNIDKLQTEMPSFFESLGLTKDDAEDKGDGVIRSRSDFVRTLHAFAGDVQVFKDCTVRDEGSS